MSTYSMPYTLSRGDREIEGRVLFTPVAPERPTRDYPGCPAYIDDVLFMDHDREIPLTDDEVRELAPGALEYAAHQRLAAMEDAGEQEFERRREDRLARAEK